MLQHRRTLGIPPKPRVFPNAWTADQDALLGRHLDIEVARRLNRTPLAVGQRRAELGIPPRLNPDAKSRPYTPAEDKLPGTLPDEELARRLNRTMFAIQARRIAFGIPKFAANGGVGVRMKLPCSGSCRMK